MFNRRPTIIQVNQPQRAEYVTREVHEHRAPTDQSVALLKEMEKAAAAKLISAVHVGDTAFECIIHKFRDNLSDRTVVCAVFSLNGKKMKAEHSYRPQDPSDDVKAATGLRDEVAKIIATEMIASSFAKIVK